MIDRLIGQMFGNEGRKDVETVDIVSCLVIPVPFPPPSFPLPFPSPSSPLSPSLPPETLLPDGVRSLANMRSLLRSDRR